MLVVCVKSIFTLDNIFLCCVNVICLSLLYKYDNEHQRDTDTQIKCIPENLLMFLLRWFCTGAPFFTDDKIETSDINWPQ